MSFPSVWPSRWKHSVGARNSLFEARFLARRCLCLHFTWSLTAPGARLEVKMVRYSFLVGPGGGRSAGAPQLPPWPRRPRRSSAAGGPDVRDRDGVVVVPLAFRGRLPDLRVPHAGDCRRTFVGRHDVDALSRDRTVDSPELASSHHLLESADLRAVAGSRRRSGHSVWGGLRHALDSDLRNRLHPTGAHRCFASPECVGVLVGRAQRVGSGVVAGSLLDIRDVAVLLPPARSEGGGGVSVQAAGREVLAGRVDCRRLIRRDLRRYAVSAEHTSGSGHPRYFPYLQCSGADCPALRAGAAGSRGVHGGYARKCPLHRRLLGVVRDHYAPGSA